jgi:hypothetical protein
MTKQTLFLVKLNGINMVASSITKNGDDEKYSAFLNTKFRCA